MEINANLNKTLLEIGVRHMKNNRIISLVLSSWLTDEVFQCIQSLRHVSFPVTPHGELENEIVLARTAKQWITSSKTHDTNFYTISTTSCAHQSFPILELDTQDFSPKLDLCGELGPTMAEEFIQRWMNAQASLPEVGSPPGWILGQNFQ